MHNQGAGRRWFTAFVVALVALAAITLTPTGARAGSAPPEPVWARHDSRTVIGIRTSRKVVALTFDDGPSARWTPTVLDLLAAHGARATFFLEGQFVDAQPALARRIVEEGNEVGNHTYSHPELPHLDAAQVISEIDRANAAFAAAGLPQPHYFRPPKGHYNGGNAGAVAQAGLRNVEWTPGLCLEKYTRSHPPAEAVRLMLARVHPGDILLAHDGGIPNRSATMAALPALLDGLQQRGYEVVTVSELLALTGRSL